MSRLRRRQIQIRMFAQRSRIGFQRTARYRTFNLFPILGVVSSFIVALFHICLTTLSFISESHLFTTGFGYIPVLAQIVLSLKVFAADFAGVGDLGTLVRPLVDHQVVGLCEAPLAELADEFTLGPHLSAEVPAVVIDSHHRKHFGRVFACHTLTEMFLN